MSPGDSWNEPLQDVGSDCSPGSWQPPSLILTGFMGTGKTAVGQEVARRLGREFVDMDREIESRAGKPVARIFAEEGEVTFRRMEAAVCRELAGRRGLVVATGGGALVDPDNQAAMMHAGTIVCLCSDPDEILRRLGTESPDRPLLDVADPRTEIERLLASRRDAYAAIPWQVDTNGLAIEEVAARVMVLASAESLVVHHPGGEYPVHIGAGLLDHAGGALRAAGVPAGSRVAVVSTPVVAPLYGARVEASLGAAGFRPLACTIPDGEQHKTLDTVAVLYGQFLAGDLDRGDTVLSLGGGVTGDVAGFAAATYMRGVRFAQLPTTLLAMADASVGGKTGVDLPQGKNLAGAFKQPIVVVIDPGTLATLPWEEIRSGMAEVVKHAILADPTLFAALEVGPGRHGTAEPLSAADLARTLRVKIDVVEEDPYERGWRASLNLGHTVGHALERLSGFTLRHGEAVSIGIVAAARLAGSLGRADPALADRVEAALCAWGLPVRCPPYPVEEIWEAMAHDKKRRGRALQWVLPRAIGRAEIVRNVPAELVHAVLHSMGAQNMGAQKTEAGEP